MGLVEVERLSEKYDLDIRWAPYLLDPSIPAEGKPRRQMTNPGDPPTQLETRGQELGLTYTRGRTRTPNSHLALQAGEFAAEFPDRRDAFHKRLFKAFFTDLEDISDINVLVRIGEAAGLPAAELREALETQKFEQQVDDGINWSRSAGVTAVPTFIFDDQYGVVGAQPFEVLDSVMQRMGKVARAT